MEKVRKWEASREQASQLVMPSQEPGAGANVVVLGMDLKEKVFVSTVVKSVILLKIGIVQLEVGSAVNVGNMVIMLAAAKGEETQSLENKVPPNDGEASSNVVVKEDRPMLLRVLLSTQVRMTHMLLL